MPTLEAGARDRKGLQAALDEAQDLVAARRRHDEAGILLVELQQRLLPGGQAEEIAGFLHPLHRRAGRRQLFAVRLLGQFGLGEERLVAHRIPALIAAEIDVPPLLQALPQRLGRRQMARFGGADEVVVGELHRLGEIAEIPRHRIGERLRLHARGGGGFFDLLTVFVGAGKETHVVSVQPHEPRQGVAGDRGVGMADVRLIVHVIDRRRDVVRSFLGHSNSPGENAGQRRTPRRRARSRYETPTARRAAGQD